MVRISKRSAVAVFALGALGVAGGGVTAALAGGGDLPRNEAGKVAPAHVFAKNAMGLTYGSELDARSPAEAPDLIAAIATNGVQGYVRKTELRPALPANPQAAERSNAQASTARRIPVFAVDGRTVVGFFTVQAASPPR